MARAHVDRRRSQCRRDRGDRTAVAAHLLRRRRFRRAGDDVAVLPGSQFLRAQFRVLDVELQHRDDHQHQSPGHHRHRPWRHDDQRHRHHLDDAEVAARAAAIGRDVDDLRSSSPLVGTPGEIADKLDPFAEAGVQRVYLQVLDQSDLDHVEFFAAEVIPQLG